MNAEYFDKIKSGTLTDEEAERHQEAVQEFRKKHAVFDINFLKNNTPSIFTIDLIERHLNQFNVLDLEKVYNRFPVPILDSTRREKLIDNIQRYQKLAVGAVAPTFTLSDTAGRQVSLACFRGKIVLLDFWASWCIPCRKENPYYLAIYEKFKNRNFKIIAVSFNKESEKASWLKAIKDDAILEWTHLSDLKGYKSPIYKTYEIGGLPQNYLVDENGVIIGHNLKGEELENKLRELLY